MYIKSNVSQLLLFLVIRKLIILNETVIYLLIKRIITEELMAHEDKYIEKSRSLFNHILLSKNQKQWI